MATQPDNPGVRVPPPLLYALAVLLGFLLDRQWPLPIGANQVRTIAAWMFVIGWAALALPAIGWFRRQKTSMIPVRPANALVLSGPYKLTRNPMYVGLALLTIGLGLFLATWWPIVLLLPALAVVQQFVILPEERYLQRRFGAEYDAYARRVRRWL